MIIAGTGHRPDKLGGYHEYARTRLVDFAKIILNRHKSTILISGMAQGWDQALAEAAISLNIRFIAMVPFKGQETAWPEESQVYYRKLLESAIYIDYVCLDGYAAWKMQKRNEKMVDHCDVVLALWNKTPGGTANCVKYAKNKKEIYNVWSDWEIFKKGQSAT